MRLIDRYLFVIGVLASAGAIGWALLGGEPTGVVSVLLIGVLLAAADLAVWVLTERRPGSLAIPAALAEVTAGGTRLPSPAWWWPALLLAGLLATGGLASAQWWLVVAGGAGALVALAALAAQTRSSAAGPLDRRLVKDARNVQGFLSRHPGPGQPEGFVVGLGRRQAKLVVIAADRQFGDLVTTDTNRARLVAELAGLAVAEPSTGSARMATGPEVWQGMSQGRPMGRG